MNSKKTIMVFDVAAEASGALTILNQYYVEALKDPSTNWIFVLSLPELEETENIKVLRYPWIKKSWLHRLYFDHFTAPKLVEENRPSEILSLQNVVVPRVKFPQTVYMHQALPFAEKRFGISENFKFWLYQNVISKNIFSSLESADKVIVQTNWIKDEITRKLQIDEKKILVSPPSLGEEILNRTPRNNLNHDQSGITTFFYPAGALEYKNHRIMIEAAQKLLEKGFTDFELVFTIDGSENKYAKSLVSDTIEKRIPAKFLGPLAREEVFELYSTSVLILPSFIESFGLPLLEAKMIGGDIFAPDLSFAHEILDGYEHATFFDPFSSDELHEIMLKKLLEYEF